MHNEALAYLKERGFYIAMHSGDKTMYVLENEDFISVQLREDNTFQFSFSVRGYATVEYAVMSTHFLDEKYETFEHGLKRMTQLKNHLKLLDQFL